MRVPTDLLDTLIFTIYRLLLKILQAAALDAPCKCGVETVYGWA